MKVLLLNPPDDLFAFLGEGAGLIGTFEPLGLLSIAAVCRRNGFEVKVIDAYAERSTVADVQRRIVDIAPDVVGITTFTSNGGIVLQLGQWLKKNLPDALVVLGNIHASVFAAEYIRNGAADVVVHGEGEEVFLQVLRRLEKGSRDFGDIPALSFLKGGQAMRTPGFAIIQDLASLPLPARDLVDQKNYHVPSVTNIPFTAGKNTVAKHMFTSRGCPRHCTFCVVHHDHRQRFFEINSVVDEIEMLIKEYGVSYLFFMDSLFISKKERVIAICREMRKRRISLMWGCEAHADFIDAELVREMEAAGCFDMAFGIESGVQRLLNTVKKGTTLPRIRDAVRTVKKSTKIKVAGLFILGLPGETYEDSLQTIRFSLRLPLDMAQFSILVPYPGSAIFDELRAKGQIADGVRPDGTLDPSVWLRYSAYISYTQNEPIWVTPALTPVLLKSLQKKAFRDFYFRPRQFLFQLKRVRWGEIGKIVKTFFKVFF